MPFDPYHHWLGIPPAEQPPNHYRLLGIAVFESDPDVISNAADRQMAHVRTFQLGQHATESQRLLSEIAAARRCLLDADTRSEYDATLQSRQSPPPQPAAPPAMLPTPLPESIPAPAMPPAQQPPAPRVAVALPRRRRKNHRSEQQAILITSGLVVVGIGLLVGLVWWTWDLVVEQVAPRPVPPSHLAPPSAGALAKKLQGDESASPEEPKSPQVAAKSALEFDGNAWVDTNLKYDGRTPLSIEVWATPAAHHDQSIVANCHGLGLVLGIGEEGHWGLWVRDQKTYRGAVSNEQARLGERVHVAGVFDGSLVQLFVNGRLQEQVGTLSSSHKVSNFRFMIGADPDFHSRPQKHFQGRIEAVHVSQNVLYDSNFTPPTTFVRLASTVLLLQFDEGEDDIAMDTSVNGQRATIHGAKWVPVSMPETRSR